MDEKRLLSYHFPEIKDNPNLPINYSFSQLYATISVKEDGTQDGCIEDRINVQVTSYQTERYEVISTLGKPISKIVQ